MSQNSTMMKLVFWLNDKKCLKVRDLKSTKKRLPLSVVVIRVFHVIQAFFSQEFDIHHPWLSLRNRGKYRHKTKQP
jgi:hypothetical protein